MEKINAHNQDAAQGKFKFWLGENDLIDLVSYVVNQARYLISKFP